MIFEKLLYYYLPSTQNSMFKCYLSSEDEKCLCLHSSTRRLDKLRRVTENLSSGGVYNVEPRAIFHIAKQILALHPAIRDNL